MTGLDGYTIKAHQETAKVHALCLLWLLPDFTPDPKVASACGAAACIGF